MSRRMRAHGKFFLSYLIPGIVALWVLTIFLTLEFSGWKRVFLWSLAGVVFLVIYWRLSRTIIRPMKEIEEGMQRYEEGFFNWKIRLRDTQSELGILGQRLNQMAEKIRDKLQDLSHSLAESEALLTGMEEGVLILDLQGRVKKLNEAMQAILTQSFPADIGKHYLEVFRDPELNDLIQATLKSERGQKRTISFINQPEKIYQVQSSRISGPDSEIGGVVVVFHDVSEMKRLERVRQEFVANVSHELRTPLTVIKGYVEALRDEDLKNFSEAQEFLKVIDRHTARMEKIVADLLLLSQLEFPGRYLRKEPIRLADLIKSAFDSVQPLVEAKKQRFESRFSSDLPPLTGDSQKMQQMLVNLLQNAVSYTPEGGQISIEAKQVGDGIQIEVADTGIGIPAEDLPRIFERFYRADKGRSRELGGTGLGLSIVKHVAEAHGGRVSVESKIGQGSRFKVFLPF